MQTTTQNDPNELLGKRKLDKQENPNSNKATTRLGPNKTYYANSSPRGLAQAEKPKENRLYNDKQ